MKIDEPVKFSHLGNLTGCIYFNYFLPFDPFFWLDLLSALIMLDGVLELL
jgi:hypothetical protein